MLRQPGFSFLLASWVVLTACGVTNRDIGTIEMEFLSDNRVTVAAVRDGTTWFAAGGVRDTSWRSDQIGLDGNGIGYSIKFDLVPPGPGPCALVLEIHLPARDASVPSILSVADSLGSPPFVEPDLFCPDVIHDLPVGMERLKAVQLYIFEGALRLDDKAWPALVGRFSGRIALQSFSAY